MGRQTTEQDKAIGARIRDRRTVLGMTQGDLGEHIGVSGVEIMRYEKGINRISGVRLQETARALGCCTTDLLGGTEITDPNHRETLTFMRNYLALPDIHKRALRRYVETLAAGSR